MASRILWLRLVVVVGLFLSLPALASAREGWRGWCEQGNKSVITSGINSTNKAQVSFPQCTVTVFLHGGGLATIFSDNNNTPLANPFLSNQDGSWIFYANDGRYDIQTSSPIFLFTYLDVLLCDPFSAGSICSNGSVGVTTINNLSGAVTLVAGTNISLVTSTVSNSITINSLSPGGTCAITNAVTKWDNPTTLDCSSGLDDGVNPTQWPLGLNTLLQGNFDQWTAASGGVTANQLLCRVNVNQVQPCPAGSTSNVVGIALNTATAGNAAYVCWAAHCSVTTTNATTAGHWLIPSATIAGQVDDTGSSTEPTGTQTFQVENSVAGGALAKTTLLSPDSVGANTPPPHANHALQFTVFNSNGLTSGTTSSNYDLMSAVPFSCTIKGWSLAIDTGTVTVKWWKVATGTAIPVAGNSINTSGVSISSGTKIDSTTLSDFTTTQVTTNDSLIMDITAVSGATILNGSLYCQE
jgi:hypothetical protein